MKLKINSLIELTVLVVVFTSLLWLGFSDSWNHQIKHDFPTGYYASDSFIHLSFSEHIKDIGNYKYYPNYMAWGFDDVIGHYPPVIHQLSALLSQTGLIETYDALIFLLVLGISLSCLAFYFVIKRFNKDIALISLPFSLLVFTKNSYIALVLGQWGFLSGAIFLITIIWAISNIEKPKSYIFLGLFLTITALSHTSEAIMGSMFLIGYILLKFIFKKLEKGSIKKSTIALIIFFILSIYFLNIFIFTWFQAEFKVEVTQNMNTFGPGDSPVMFSDFGFFFPIIILGMLYSLYLLYKKRFHPSLLMGFFMILMGFTYLIGSGRRATQARVFWPIYLSIFLGIAIYYTSKFFIKNWNRYYSLAISAVIFILAINIFPTPISGNGLMHPPYWEYFDWVSENIQEDSKIIYLYSDIWSQNAIIYTSKRNAFIISKPAYIENLQKGTLPRIYSGKTVSEGGVGYPHQNSLFSFGYYLEELDISNYAGNFDICSFSHIAFDKFAQNPAISNSNNILYQELLKNNWIKLVYENEMVILLENTEKEKDCLPIEGVKI